MTLKWKSFLLLTLRNKLHQRVKRGIGYGGLYFASRPVPKVGIFDIEQGFKRIDLCLRAGWQVRIRKRAEQQIGLAGASMPGPETELAAADI